MSGGAFDYNQYRINDIADSIEERLAKVGKTRKEIAKMDAEKRGYESQELDIFSDPEHMKWKEKYDAEIEYDYSAELVEELKRAVVALRRAYVYAQRVDWFFSGDDGEKEFFSRLDEELKEVGGERKNSQASTIRRLKAKNLQRQSVLQNIRRNLGEPQNIEKWFGKDIDKAISEKP